MTAPETDRYTVLIDPRPDGGVFGAEAGATVGGPGSVLLRVVTVPLADFEAVCADRDEARTDLGQIAAMLLPDQGPPIQGVHALLDELRIARERIAELEAGR